MFGDHSGLVPLLPIPNRTVKRTSADDSMDSHAKVGHRQTPYAKPLWLPSQPKGFSLGYLMGETETKTQTQYF